MVLINQEEAINDINAWIKSSEYYKDDKGVFLLQMVKNTISKLSPQEIIHCEDCAHHDWALVDGPYALAQEIHWCNKLYDGDAHLAVLPNDFCNWGKRKGEVNGRTN